MTKSCIDSGLKKVLLDRLEEKCSIDDSSICDEIVPFIESLPECGTAPRKRRTRTPVFHPDETDRDEQSEVDDLPKRPMGMIPVMGMPERRKVKRPRKLSNYQKHQSVCLAPGSGLSFQECVQKWRKGESLADQYKGSGRTK